jgi:hypothetical protein
LANFEFRNKIKTSRATEGYQWMRNLVTVSGDTPGQISENFEIFLDN